MHPTLSDIAKTLGEIEDGIIHVGTLLDTHPVQELDAQVSVMDRSLRAAYEAADATARLLALLRDPLHEEYAPVELIRSISAHHPAAVTRRDLGAAVRLCRGDVEQVAESVRILVENIELATDAALSCEVITGEGIPRIVFALDAPAEFPDTLSLGGVYAVSLEDFGHRWCAASAGGQIAQAPQTLILYLEGGREIPAAQELFNRAAQPAKKLARSLRNWRGAIGHFEPGYASPEEIASLYREALAKTHACLQELRQALGARRN